LEHKLYDFGPTQQYIHKLYSYTYVAKWWLATVAILKEVTAKLVTGCPEN